MQSSNAPSKIQLPFAASGTKNTIPVPSQQGVTPGAASFTDGFPPLTFTPLSAGGVPPAGADFNGILNQITALQQWKSAGGQFPFDATFATAIGGYPKGATVLKADGTGLWISTAENNTANPDTGGTGWLAFSASSIQAGSYNAAHDAGAVNAYAMTINPAPAALTPGMKVTLLNTLHENTGASTLNVNGMGAIPIIGGAGNNLEGAEIGLNADVTFTLRWDGTAWIIDSSSNSSLQVRVGVQQNQAVNLGQFAASPGNSGYQILASGIIFQWGVIPPGLSVDVNFPIAFPTTLYVISVFDGNFQSSQSQFGTNNRSLSGFTAKSNSTGEGMQFIAIGN